jgi:hypothetical protein
MNVLSACLLENLDSEILKVYLSQNKPEISKSLMVQEFSFVSEAFAAAQALVSKKISLVDFRVVRTFPINVILVSTAAQASDFEMAKGKMARSNTIIDQVEDTLKHYFQIVKN